MEKIRDIFGCNVFNDEVMKERLPKSTYKKLKSTIEEGLPLDRTIASVVANAMKDWAISKGATHFTHWFQPMTGITAEKHDSFISPLGTSDVVMEFSGSNLIKGEPDASSFPNGGSRTTFEARGYTAWDPTSYAFVKGTVLYIPSIFCSYSGDSLDKKTPLLKSIDVINKEALRVLSLFGSEATYVYPTVGPEQEYFLIDKEKYNLRRDLKLTGRTLFGTAAPKGQELDDHYFGSIDTRVQGFMNELNEELWKFGILSKTEHKEVAPGQYELAPIFTNVNSATDQNQLTMELMETIADKHGFVCLLHEKPFANINGSGKHNNWSLSTNLGENLLEPGETPSENAQFLVFLISIIRAVDKHQDLLRISVSSASNDHRLGADEAPPAIVSIFVGEDLEEVLMGLEKGETIPGKGKQYLKVGSDVLPYFRRDLTDRNRTSPFAFTGNKFEFRMLGSNFSVSCTNQIMNTIIGDELKDFADKMEKAEDFHEDLNKWILESLKEHKKIIFNGNGYDESWVKEAADRGLLNYCTAPEAIIHYTDDKNVDLFTRHGIFNKEEMTARQHTLFESYSNAIKIETATMIDMVQKDILPAVINYMQHLSKTIKLKKELDLGLGNVVESEILIKVNELTEKTYIINEELKEVFLTTKCIGDVATKATTYCEKVIPIMQKMRVSVDGLEEIVAKEYWPMPSYEDILF